VSTGRRGFGHLPYICTLYFADFTLNAPPSLVPAKKYSDISGLPAPYADPHTKLRFANADEYASMQHMPSDIINGYLTVRGYTSAVG